MNACPLMTWPQDALHGVCIMPPVLAWNGLRYQGNRLKSWDDMATQALPGVITTVTQENFLGIVAVSGVYARQASGVAAVHWLPPSKLIETPPASACTPETYHWSSPQNMSTGVSEVTVWVSSDQVGVWLPQDRMTAALAVQTELSHLLQLRTEQITIAPVPHALPPCGCELALIDAAAEAALLSNAVLRPVTVQCRFVRAQALTLSTSSTPSETSISAATAAPDGSIAPAQAGHVDMGTVWQAPSVWNVRPSWARLLTQSVVRPTPMAMALTELAPVAWKSGQAIATNASALELLAAQVFAHESYAHDQAVATGQDPMQARLQAMSTGRGKALAQQVIAQLEEHHLNADGRLHGRGFATASVRYTDAAGQEHQAWSTWVADVAVQPETGNVSITRVMAGHDTQHLHAAQPATSQSVLAHDTLPLLAHAKNLVASPSNFDTWTTPATTTQAVTLSIAGGLAQASPTVNTGSLATDGVLTLPAAAAIANAIEQATGVRLRQAPFNTEQLRLALTDDATHRLQKRYAKWSFLAAGAGIFGVLATAWPVKSALPLTDGPDVSVYSAQALERGRLVAAAGDCIVCHTAPGGIPNAGGLGLETPFGTIYSTNITPDLETGIGRWSYAAFERAMRHGIHQDGRQLYPAFPYTDFAKLSDGDLQSLYGYLMSQPAVASQSPTTQLAFPYNLRPAMAGWNALFHDATPFKPDPARTPEWNRGAYLVEGAGHCGACHTPRNALGAERTGPYTLSGGEAEGWIAPALNQLATGPRRWEQQDLARYLRTGYSAQHGVAAGPMSPVIHGLAQLPESDIQAIASYLLSLSAEPKETVQHAATAKPPTAALTALGEERNTAAPLLDAHVNGQRIYDNACAVCHNLGSGPTLFGVKPDLSANSSIHSDSARNLVQVILHGISNPAQEALGYMPGFSHSLDDEQITDLVRYVRARFAPQGPAWEGLPVLVKEVRQQGYTGH